MAMQGGQQGIRGPETLSAAGANSLRPPADPSRRRLLDLLYGHDGQTLGDLCSHLDMTRQAVTQHLGALEAANLIATVRRGRQKLHFLNPVPLQEIYERGIRKFDKPRLRALHDLKRLLEGDRGE
jgi:DNA-binding transcriptional ArsR family regulator